MRMTSDGPSLRMSAGAGPTGPTAPVGTSAAGIDTRWDADEARRAHGGEVAACLPEGCHVSERELACHDAQRTPYPAERAADGTLARLVGVFEGVRAAAGRPIAISCGYRTPEHNALVGGVPRSQHVQGRALDLRTPKGLRLSEFHALLRRRAAADERIGGLGLYPWGAHVDVRPRAEPADRQPRGRSYAYWVVHSGDTA